MPEELARRIQTAPDLLRRARNQRVCALSVNDVLEVVLGVRVVGAETPYMQQLALEHVERLGHAMSRSDAADRRGPEAADRATGGRERGGAGADAASLGASGDVGARSRHAGPTTSAMLVREAMPTLHGDEGRVLAWALAQPERACVRWCLRGGAYSRGGRAPEARVGAALEGRDGGAAGDGPAHPAAHGDAAGRGHADGAG